MRVQHLPGHARTFTPWGEGAEIAILRVHDAGGVTTLTRFHAGATGKFHTHPGGEELYVLQGRARIGETEVQSGDYLYTPPGAGHNVFAHEETLLLLVLPLAPDYSAKPD